MNIKFFPTFIFSVILFLCMNLNAKNFALVIALRSGNQQLSDTNKVYCETLNNIFEYAGMKKENITFFFEGGNSEFQGASQPEANTIIAKCNDFATKLSKKDRLWIFIFGHASATEKSIFLATQGKRLKGKKFAHALAKIKAEKFIYCLNTEAYALYSVLCKSSEKAVFSATNSKNQLNPPRLPQFLLSYWQACPDGNLIEIFKNAVKLTLKYYNESNTAYPEESEFFDGEKQYKPPFENAEKSYLSQISITANTNMQKKSVTNSKLEDNSNSNTNFNGNNLNLNFEEIDAMIKTGEKIAELPKLHTATTETLNLIKKTQELAKNYSRYKAFYTKRALSYTINNDWSTVYQKNISLYIIDDTAAENYANLHYNDYPPDNETIIKNARIIYPDGSFRLIEDDIMTNSGSRFHNVKFPGATGGVLISLTISNTSTPVTQRNFNNEFLFQKNIPVLNTKLTLRFPKNQYFAYKFYNMNANVKKSENEYSKIFSFELKNSSPLEYLPYNPPLKYIAARMVVSSMKSWNDFREWVGRMMKGCMELDEKTEKLILKLTKNALNDTEKVKALYEFLCELRYETTPVGARAFKPRTPPEVCDEKYGDCKDKANALVAMAAFLGIKGFVTLVNRMSFTDSKFPSWQFNHAIAFFPNLTGYPNGLWCDATDGATTFGSIPPGDIGRNAFIIKDNSSFEFKEISLPFNANNSFNESIEISLLQKNKPTASVSISTSGLNDYYLRQTLKRQSPVIQQYTIQKIIDQACTGISINSISSTPIHNLKKPFQITAKCDISDSELLLHSPFNPPKNYWSVVAMKNRTTPLMLNDNQPFSVSQTIIIKGKLPLHFEKKISCPPYAQCRVKFDSFDNSYRRTIEIKIEKPMIPADDYQKFRAFIIQLYKNLHTQ